MAFASAPDWSAGCISSSVSKRKLWCPLHGMWCWYQIHLIFGSIRVGWGVGTWLDTWLWHKRESKRPIYRSLETPLIPPWRGCYSNSAWASQQRQGGQCVQGCEINGNSDWQGAFTIHFLSQFHHCLLLLFDVWLKRHHWNPEWGQQVLYNHYGQLLILCAT